MHVRDSNNSRVWSDLANALHCITIADKKTKNETYKTYSLIIFLQLLPETVILSTAIVIVKNQYGFKHECKVLLDSSS